MGLRDRLYLLTEVADVDEFIQNFPTSAIFKAGTCHKTTQGFAQVEKVLDPHERINLAFVRVVEQRPVSDYVAQLTGVVHQSPQLILFVHGKPVYDVDNWSITQVALSAAADRYLVGGRSSPFAGLDVAEHVAALQGLVSGQLDECAFTEAWKALPRDHAVFNDFEAVLRGEGCCGGGCSSLPLAQKRTAQLKIKAGQLLALFRAWL